MTIIEFSDPIKSVVPLLRETLHSTALSSPVSGHDHRLGHRRCRQVLELQPQKLPHPKGLEGTGKGVEFVRGPPNGRTLWFCLVCGARERIQNPEHACAGPCVELASSVAVGTTLDPSSVLAF